MIILAIDTATEILSVAVADTGRGTLHRYCADAGFRHGSRLLDTIAWLLKSADLQRSDIGAIACCDGPGSFTGLRIGLATAKGFSAALCIPVHAVPTLNAIACCHRQWPGPVVAAIDARKNRFYAAVFRHGDKVTADLDLDAGALSKVIGVNAGSGDPVLLTGPAAAELSLRLGQANGTGMDLRVDPEHRSGAAAGLIDLVQTQGSLFIASDDHGPHYVRSSDAEIGITVPKTREKPFLSRRLDQG